MTTTQVRGGRTTKVCVAKTYVVRAKYYVPLILFRFTVYYYEQLCHKTKCGKVCAIFFWIAEDHRPVDTAAEVTRQRRVRGGVTPKGLLFQHNHHNLPLKTFASPSCTHNFEPQ